MSDMLSHSRNDLNELPDSTMHVCGCSPALCETCTPRRSLIAALRDISAKRDIPLRYFSAEVVCLAERRRLCRECGKYPADLPGPLCPGCEAYKEHQR